MTSSRPPIASYGLLLARWATVAVLCGIVVSISLRRTRPAATENAVQPEMEPAAFISVATPHEPVRILPPDFLEPLPLTKLTPVEDEREAPSEALPPAPALVLNAPQVEPPSTPLPPPSESIDEIVEREVASDQPPSMALPVESQLASIPTAEPSAPIEIEEQVLPEPAEFDEDAELAAQLTPEDLLTYSPAVAEISQKMLPEVREAFQLAQHGATHAAHEKFVRVLKRIAQAKDVEAMTDRHARSLEDGLRALDEADDFMPAGGVSLALDLAAISATHQTPMLKIHQAKYTLPYEAVALYHRYAQQKLGAAVAGEQAGSMALHGLGKIHSRWADLGEDTVAITRRGMTMYRAALVAHPQNHLAANELGVMLAQAGRYDQAATALEWAAQLAGTSTIYHNLAHVQRQRGEVALAAAAEAHSVRLAQLERTSGEVARRHGVQWVSPQDFARVSEGGSQMAQRTASASTPAAEEPSAPPKPEPQPRMSTPAPRGGNWR